MTVSTCRVEWGSGFAAIHRNLTVLMADDSSDLRDDIWIAVRSGGIDQVLDALMSDGQPRSTSFVVANEEEEGLRIFLRGDAVVQVRTDGNDEEFDAAGMRTWSERLIADWAGFTAIIEPRQDQAGPVSLIESGVVSASSCERSSMGSAGPQDPVSNSTRKLGIAAPRPAVDDQLSIEADSSLPSSVDEGSDAAETSSSGSANANAEPASSVAPIDVDAADPAEDEAPSVEQSGDGGSDRELADAVADADKGPEDVAHADITPDPQSDSSYSEMFGATRHRSVLGAAISDPEAPVLTMISDVPKSDSPAPGPNRSESTWLNRNFGDGDETAAVLPDPGGAGDHDGHTLSIDEVRRLRGATPDSAAPLPASSDSGAAVVQALVCPDGHPNPTYDAVCRVCGVALDGSPCVISRPPLGRLRFSTGDDVVLDRPLLVGRKPDPKGRRFSDIPRLLQLDVGDGLSRSHALVLLEGWQVRIEDLGSTNDTTVTLPGREPQRLRSGEPVLIVDGTTIDLGGEVNCVFDAHV